MQYLTNPVMISHLIKNYAVIIQLKHAEGETDEQVERERKTQIWMDGHT